MRPRSRARGASSVVSAGLAVVGVGVGSLSLPAPAASAATCENPNVLPPPDHMHGRTNEHDVRYNWTSDSLQGISAEVLTRGADYCNPLAGWFPYPTSAYSGWVMLTPNGSVNRWAQAGFASFRNRVGEDEIEHFSQWRQTSSSTPITEYYETAASFNTVYKYSVYYDSVEDSLVMAAGVNTIDATTWDPVTYWGDDAFGYQWGNESTDPGAAVPGGPVWRTEYRDHQYKNPSGWVTAEPSNSAGNDNTDNSGVDFFQDGCGATDRCWDFWSENQ